MCEPSSSVSPPSDKMIKNDTNSLEGRLKDAVKQRENTQLLIKSRQVELQTLLNTGVKRPTATIEELDQNINELESKRTTNSLSLKEEREVLKQIFKLEKAKRQLTNNKSHFGRINELKEHVSELRNSIKRLGLIISEGRAKMVAVKTAAKLGCTVEDLASMKVSLPPEQLGRIIGKKGSNLRHLMEKLNVVLDVESDKRNLLVVGQIDSLEAAANDLEKIMKSKEVLFEVSSDSILYFCSNNIAAFKDIRDRHPDIQSEIVRGKKSIRAIGAAEDIESFTQDVRSFDISSKHVKVQRRESSLLVGKQGATIDKLERLHQTAIRVERNEDSSSTVFILGPLVNVEVCLEEINSLWALHEEISERVALSPIVHAVLQLNGGAGVQGLTEMARSAIDDTDAGKINVNFDNDDNIVVRAKTSVMPRVLEIVKKEVERLEQSIVRIKTDPFAIPVLVGKGGAVMKEWNTKFPQVKIDLNRVNGEVTFCGLDDLQMRQAVDIIQATLDANIVDRVPVRQTPSGSLFRDLMRSDIWHEISSDVFIGCDDDKSELVLRGTSSNVEATRRRINEFVAGSYTESVDATEDDIAMLLRGGKTSKIVDFSERFGVHLKADRDTLTITAKGEQEKATLAIKEVKCLLYGGDGIKVCKVPLDDESVALVIGKGGKTKLMLESAHKSVTITISRNFNEIVLRGEPNAVEACRFDILKVVATSRISRTVALPQNKQNSLVKIRKVFGNSADVQITTKANGVVVRGMHDEVQYAVALITEQAAGVYRSQIRLGSKPFRQIQDVFHDATQLDRIKLSSGADIALNCRSKSIDFEGTQPNVATAKLEIIKLFSSVLPTHFGAVKVPGPLQPYFFQAHYLAEVTAEAGASVMPDRDCESLFVISDSSEKVQLALALLKNKSQEYEKLVYVLQMDASEGWVLPGIIGKGGQRIKALRKQTSCTINADTTLRRLTVSASSVEVLTKGRLVIEKVVDQMRKENEFIEIPDEDMAEFVGRGGSNVSEFEKKYSVQVQTMKKMGCKVHLVGDKTAVAAAKAALIDWIAARHAKQNEKLQSETLHIRRSEVTAILGPNGANVQQIQKEFACKIDIDRAMGVVTVRGGTVENCARAVDKIKCITDSETNPEDLSASSSGHETKYAFCSALKPAKNIASPHEKPILAKISVLQGEDFPILESRTADTSDSSDSTEHARETEKTLHSQVETRDGVSWARIVEMHPRSHLIDGTIQAIDRIDQVSKDLERRSFSRMVSESDWDATSVNSDDSMEAELSALKLAENDLRKALSIATMTVTSSSASSSGESLDS